MASITKESSLNPDVSIDGFSPNALLLGRRTRNRYQHTIAELAAVTKLSFHFEYVHPSPIQFTSNVDTVRLNQLRYLSPGWMDF